MMFGIKDKTHSLLETTQTNNNLLFGYPNIFDIAIGLKHLTIIILNKIGQPQTFSIVILTKIRHNFCLLGILG